MSQQDSNHLKEWLQPKIKALGLSVEQFANRIGVTRAIVYHWMKDTCRPDEDTMVRVCRELGEPLEEGLRQYTARLEGRAGWKTKTLAGRSITVRRRR